MAAGEEETSLKPCTAEHMAATARAGGSNGKKQRLSDADVKFILAMKSEPCPTAEDFPTLRTNNPVTFPDLPPGYVEERRRYLAEKAALAEKLNAHWDEFRAGVVEEYRAKGYVEVDDEYFAERAKSEAWVKEQWATLDFSRFTLARADDEELEGFMIGYGEEIVHYGHYVAFGTDEHQV